MTDPILFVPGLNCTEELFSPQIAALSPGRATMVADQRRHDTIAGMAAAALAAAPPRFVLAGLSMGGYVTLEIMRQAPERVSRLVLMDTSARPDTEDSKRTRERLIAIAEAGRFAEIPDLQVPSLLAPARMADPSLLGVIRRMAADTGPDAFVRQQRAIMGRVDSRPHLGRIGCPVLMIVGDLDRITPPDHAAEIAAAVPDGTLVVIPGVGHLSTLEAPDVVNSALDHFLAGPGGE